MTPEVDAFFDKLDFPMYIVTAAADAKRAGCLVGFVTQCSIEPPRLVVCLSEKNFTHEVGLKAPALALHLVPEQRTDLVELFGSNTGYEVDKFARCDWTPGPGNVPLLAGCRSRLVCQVLDRRSVGDHTAFVVEPIEGASGEERPYMFSRAKIAEVEPGQPP